MSWIHPGKDWIRGRGELEVWSRSKPGAGSLTVNDITARLAAEQTRAAIAREDEQTGREVIDSHAAPRARLTLPQARKVLQVHRACDRATCPKKTAAWDLRVAAGEIVPDRRVSY